MFNIVHLEMRQPLVSTGPNCEHLRPGLPAKDNDYPPASPIQVAVVMSMPTYDNWTDGLSR